MTLQISLFSIVIGTLLGMVICALRRSRLRIIRGIAAGYIAVVRGSPVVLLLMLMYYVVFAGSGVSALMVAVAAFSLHMSAYTAACFYGNVQGYESEREELLITDDYYTDNVFYVTKDYDMDKILEAMEEKQG